MELGKRFHSFSSIHEGPQGWDWCMSKAYCKYPVIVVIIIAAAFFFLAAYCCLRCCGFCGGRRSRNNRARRSTQPSRFNPMPYQGYQPANNPATGYVGQGYPPPGPLYGGQEPARYAQFDTPTRKINDDSLPAMPSWDGAQSRKIEDNSYNHMDTDLELQQRGPGQAPPPQLYSTGGINASTLDLSSGPPAQTHSRAPSEYRDFRPGHSRVDSSTPMSTAYTGPDFGVGGGGGGGGVGSGEKTGYTGPDFGAPKSYTAYSS